MMKHSLFGWAMTVMAVTALATPALSQDRRPVVVELFTSQGCYSCPPAEAYLGELAGRDDIVALEFHVDYWDSLVYGWHGKWKDPFSSADHTRRQQFYNMSIRGKSGVYTPQMVIDGRLEAVGSRRGHVDRAIGRAAADRKLTVSFTQGASPQAKVAGDGGQGGIYLVRFIKQAVTRIKSGENHGKTLKSHNIVKDVRRLAPWRGAAKSIPLPDDARADDGHGGKFGCAVIVQAANQGPIMGAGLCP